MKEIANPQQYVFWRSGNPEGEGCLSSIAASQSYPATAQGRRTGVMPFKQQTGSPCAVWGRCIPVLEIEPQYVEILTSATRFEGAPVTGGKISRQIKRIQD